MSTRPEHAGLVPDPDFCIVLFDHGFPQKTKFYWTASGILTAKQEEVWVLLSADELEAHGLEPGKGKVFAAPICEEFMRLTPLQYYVGFARFGYIFIDITKTTMEKEAIVEGKAHQAVGVSFFRIKEADAATAANCWAKGFCYLLIKKMMQISKPAPANAAS